MRATFESWLHRQWTKRGLLAWALSPLSVIFLCIARNRRMKTKPHRLPVPVVVVGNIYVGGTGKTPVTIALVKELVKRGYHPGVVSRGFGRKEDAPQMVLPDSPAVNVGDEPLLIARQTQVPVAVARDRVAAALLLLDKHPECDLIISDDGLQHYALARDVELAVVGARGLGNGWVLPAGPLREPPSRLDEVDAIVLNATEDSFDSRTPRFAATATLGRAKSLDGTRCLSLDEMELGDHYAFDDNPFKDSKEEFILITGKDAVKCRQHPDIAQDPRIYTVEYLVDIDPYLVDLIEHKLKEKAQKENGS